MHWGCSVRYTDKKHPKFSVCSGNTIFQIQPDFNSQISINRIQRSGRILVHDAVGIKPIQ